MAMRLAKRMRFSFLSWDPSVRLVCELSVPSPGDVGGTIGRRQVGGQAGRPAYVE